MKVGPRLIITVASVLTLVFLRLGFWQLSRLSERKQLNAELASRAVDSAVPISQLPTDTALAHYRRVLLEGNYDYDNEIVLSFRSREGSPGVNIVTPLALPGTDTVLMVVRGWVYSPDGTTVDLPRWREANTLKGEGFVETYPPPRAGVNGSSITTSAYRWLDRSRLEKRIRHPLKPYYAVLTSPPVDSVHTPPRLRVPPMDEGPHRSYAIQWFSFAAISIIGTVLFLRRK